MLFLTLYIGPKQDMRSSLLQPAAGIHLLSVLIQAHPSRRCNTAYARRAGAGQPLSLHFGSAASSAQAAPTLQPGYVTDTIRRRVTLVLAVGPT